jgi:hypothetical protein
MANMARSKRAAPTLVAISNAMFQGGSAAPPPSNRVRITHPISAGDACPTCGDGLMVVRSGGAYQPFLACSGYPSCKTTAALAPTDQVNDVRSHRIASMRCGEVGEPRRRTLFSADQLAADRLDQVTARWTKPVPGRGTGVGVGMPMGAGFGAGGRLSLRSRSRPPRLHRETFCLPRILPCLIT